MFRASRLFATAALSTVGLVGLSVPQLSSPMPERQTVAFDIAMNGQSMSFEGATTPQGLPAKGTPFIVEGYLYPHGTFAEQGTQSGVLADGSPEFPNLVIGTWSCRGWHLQDAGATTGPFVATEQVFDLNPARPGSEIITTSGVEVADMLLPFERAVSGGTGAYAGLTGQYTQVNLAPNASFGFNLTVDFDIRGDGFAR